MKMMDDIIPMVFGGAVILVAVAWQIWGVRWGTRRAVRAAGRALGAKVRSRGFEGREGEVAYDVSLRDGCLVFVVYAPGLPAEIHVAPGFGEPGGWSTGDAAFDHDCRVLSPPASMGLLSAANRRALRMVCEVEASLVGGHIERTDRLERRDWEDENTSSRVDSGAVIGDVRSLIRAASSFEAVGGTPSDRLLSLIQNDTDAVAGRAALVLFEGFPTSAAAEQAAQRYSGAKSPLLAMWSARIRRDVPELLRLLPDLQPEHRQTVFKLVCEEDWVAALEQMPLALAHAGSRGAALDALIDHEAWGYSEVVMAGLPRLHAQGRLDLGRDEAHLVVGYIALALSETNQRHRAEPLLLSMVRIPGATEPACAWLEAYGTDEALAQLQPLAAEASIREPVQQAIDAIRERYSHASGGLALTDDGDSGALSLGVDTAGGLSEGDPFDV